MAMHRLQDTLGQSASAKAEQEEKMKLRGEVEQYKREAEEVSLQCSNQFPSSPSRLLAKLDGCCSRKMRIKC
jgi:hypothetical protein